MKALTEKAWGELQTTVTGLLRNEVEHYFQIGDWMTRYLAKSGYTKHYAFACHVAIEINNRTGDDKVADYYADAWKAALLSSEERNLFTGKPGYTVTNVRDFVHIRKELRRDKFEEIRHLTPPIQIRARAKTYPPRTGKGEVIPASPRVHGNGMSEDSIDPAPQRGIVLKVKNERGEFDPEMVTAAFKNLVSVVPTDCLSEAWPDVLCVVEKKLKGHGKRSVVVSKDGFPDLSRMAL